MGVLLEIRSLYVHLPNAPTLQGGKPNYRLCNIPAYIQFDWIRTDSIYSTNKFSFALFGFLFYIDFYCFLLFGRTGTERYRSV